MASVIRGSDAFDSATSLIAMADQWKLITQHATNADITAWGKVAFTGAGFIGTGMSMSTYVTTDNSTYVYADAIVDGNNGSGVRNGGASGLVIVDVTDTANVKVKFNASTLNSGSALNAYAANSTTPNATSVTFIRLGNT